MSRDRESLIDIANAIRRILRYADRVSRAELEANDEKLSAILYQITVAIFSQTSLHQIERIDIDSQTHIIRAKRSHLLPIGQHWL